MKPAIKIVCVGLACGLLPTVTASAVNAPTIDEAGVPVRGVVRAVDQAQISTDLMARIEKIGFRAGEAFKKGDVLVAFDCVRYRADAQSADATWREMKLTLDSNEQLEKFRAVGRHDVEISKARVDKAEADARGLAARVAQCEILAPYDGRVADLSVHVHEQPQPNAAFLSIVGAGKLEIELIVPSNWLTWLKVDSTFAFNVDETDREYQGRVVRVGASVDAISQMVKVIAIFDTAVTDILPGMSGSATFTQPNG